jgi:hypothetical protein
LKRKKNSIISSVIRGVGEMDVYKKYINRFPTTPETPKTANSEQINLEYEERPYLIVDLRDKDEFSTNHIVSGNFIYLYHHNLAFFFYIAHHYPAAMLSRCTNNESKELLIYVILFTIHIYYLTFFSHRQ